MNDEIVELNVKLPKETIAKLRNFVMVRMLAGASWGLSDAFVKRMLACIDEGKTEHIFEIRGETD